MEEHFDFKDIVRYIPFLVLFFILFFIHLSFSYSGDDLVYKGVVDYQPWTILINEVVHRYFDWSSRVIIDFNVLLFTYIPIFIWKILNTLVLVGMAVLIPGLFSRKGSLKNNIISAVLVLVFYSVFQPTLVCGVIATNLNYSWPLFFLVLNLWLLKNYILNQDAALSNFKKAVVYILLIYSLLFACNHEQVFIACGIIYLFLIAYCYYKNRSFNKTVLFMFLLIILSGIFIFTCPGNFHRFDDNVAVWLPEFANYSIFNKANIGIATIFHLSIGNIVSYLFFLVFGIYNYVISRKKLLSGFIGFIPFIVSTAFGILFLYPIIPEFNAFLDSFVSYTLFTSSFNIACDLFYLIMFLAILYGLYNIYRIKGLKTALPLFVLLLAGCVATFIIGFTPSMFTSMSRMLLIFEFLLCLCIYYIVELIDRNHAIFRNLF